MPVFRFVFIVFFLFFSLPVTALNLSQYTCSQGEELGRLRGEDFRTMFFTYHDGYLIQNRHGGSMTKVWSLDDPSNPQLLRRYDDNLWEGQHVHSFMGLTELYHWSGKHQVSLANLPDLVEADPIFNADDLVNSYYPFGFSGVARSYQYQRNGHFSINDLRTPNQDVLSRVNVMEETGFEGSVNLIGNLLIVTGDNEMPYGVAIYDVGDPSSPNLLDSIRTTRDGKPLIKAYDSVPVWGSYIFLIQNGDTTAVRGIDVIDFSDPNNLKHVGRYDFEGRTRYAQFQDHYMFVGSQKIDLRTFKAVATYPDGGGEYNLPVGNLLITAGMHRKDNGRVWCHQSEADTSPPIITFHSPQAKATQVPLTGRVGIIIPETLDLNTITSKNIVLRPMHGLAVPADIVSTDHDVINITPKKPLLPNTTYEFIMFADGVKDVAGNGFKEDFYFTFSTGQGISKVKPPTINHFSLSHKNISVGEDIEAVVQVERAAIEPLNYTLNWGDGTKSELSQSSAFSHQYKKPGVYTLQASVTNSQGRRSSKTQLLVVEHTVNHTGVSSSTLRIDTHRNWVWNVNPDHHSVTATHLLTGQRIHEIIVPLSPTTLSLDHDHNVWVVSEEEGAITAIDGDSGELLKTFILPVGALPQGIVQSPTQDIAYVSAMGSGRVYRVDTQHYTLTGELALGPWPRAMAISYDGKSLLVTRFISPDHQGEVYYIDTASFDDYSVIPLHIDQHTDSDRGGRGLPNYLLSIAIDPSGTTAWVGSKKDNILRGLKRDGRALTFESTVRSIISFIDLPTKQEMMSRRIDTDNHELPSAITFSPDGVISYVAFRGNNSVSAYISDTLQILDSHVGGKTPIGLAVNPQNKNVLVHNYLSRSIDALTLFTGPEIKGPKSIGFKSIGFKSIGPKGKESKHTLGAFKRVTSMATVSKEILPKKELLGKQLFNSASDPRISRDGYVSCASCHLDGGHDGRTWDFTDRGEGLRNTISLKGRKGEAHGRMHWSANFDEVQDFEHDIRGPFSGRGLMADKAFSRVNHSLDARKKGASLELDALALYSQSLNQHGISPFRTANGQLSAKAKKGQQLFKALNCRRCHSGRFYTDSPKGLRHDVGTITPLSAMRLNAGKLNAIDTPTLKGLWNSAPYFHDGSAPVLMDVINKPTHGDAQHLQEEDKHHLVEYLKQIDDLEHHLQPQYQPIHLKLLGLKNNDVIAATHISLAIETNVQGIKGVTYYANDKVVASSYTAPYSLKWNAVHPGRQRIYAQITHRDGSTTVSKDIWVTVQGRSLNCRIGTIERWRGGFVAKDIVVENTGENIMRDWAVRFMFSGDITYEKSWDTVVTPITAREIHAKGYIDDRDLKPNEAITFGFIVSHAPEHAGVKLRCVVDNAISHNSDLSG